MVKQFSPSQNILLNNFNVSDYIITPNTQEVFEALTSNYASGIRSINLIGAYGTGKSTFLNALNYHFNVEDVFVDNKRWKKFKRYDFIKIVGNYDSIIDNLAHVIGSSSNKGSVLVSELESLIKVSNAEGRGLMVVIDEFGKFLEHASANGAEKELYFLQQIAEVINNTEYEAGFITTLHQDFSAYSVGLNSTQRNEWTKVKGRFKELTFNEPVEQLLLLASKRLAAQPTSSQTANIGSLIQIIEKAKAFPLKDYFDDKIANDIYPLDLLSGSVLALALQQYGQNERSLFGFLNTDSFYGLGEFDENRQNFYAVSNVYDYLNYNLYSYLNSKANIHYSKWAEIKNALERVEGEVEDHDHILYQTLIKTIGILNIFTHAGAKLDQGFLISYIELTGKLTGVEDALLNLQRKNLLAYNKYSNRFFYSETTIVNIDDAIAEASLEISRANNIVNFLNGYLPLAPVSAKRAYYEKGTPRTFEYKISDVPYNSSKPKGQIDGFINLIFNENIKETEIVKASIENNQAVLYAHFLRVADIQHAIEEIEKAKIAKAKYPNDKIIQRELSAIEEIQKNLLNYYLYEGFYDVTSVKWYYKGASKQFNNSKEFNAFLSTIIDGVYPLTPKFISELANRSKLSSTIASARRLLIHAILSHESEEGLGIEGFPPHKSIYLSLLKQTGIHRATETGWVLREITDSTKDHNGLIPLFSVCNKFIDSTRGAKRSVKEFYELLEEVPFKLKKGFLDFWIPIYFIMKTDDFALYGATDNFIPELDSEVLELLVKNPHQYTVKAYDTDGIKIRLFNQYRELLALDGTQRTSNEAFIKTIIPFFKFYKDLKPYVKQTRKLSQKTIALKRALTEATEPEKLFFEDFPNALNYDLVQLNNNPELLADYSADLQESIRELRNAFDALLDRFEGVINGLWKDPCNFATYTQRLKTRFETSLKQYLLLPYQKTFYDRLCSPLQDRAAWLSSVAQATIGKTLDQITDKEEDQLQERFLNLIHELDNLNDMALQQIDIDQEDVFKFQLTTPGKSSTHKIIRIPKTQDAKFHTLERGMSDLIGTANRSTKIAILAKLLKQVIDDEGT